MSEHLPATGERYLPDSMSGEIAIEHLHRYHAAVTMVEGLDVLDIASGEGYGSYLLAGAARNVVGVDISTDAITFSTGKYTRGNLRFAQGTCAAIPLPDASVDAIVSFETIEHHDEHEAMLAEFKRVLRPGGFIVLSSPDRHEYSDVPGYANPYHLKELYRSELEALLSRWFKSFRLYGQRVRQASTIFNIDPEMQEGAPIINSEFDGSEVINGTSGLAARYFVAVASDTTPVPELPTGCLVDLNNETVEYQAQIATLKMDIVQLQEDLRKERRQIEIYGAQTQKLTGELERWRQHATNLEIQVEGQERAIKQLSNRNALLLKEAHDSAVALIAEKMSHESGSLRTDAGAISPESDRAAWLEGGDAGVENPNAQTVLFHLELGKLKAQLNAVQAESANQLLQRDQQLALLIGSSSWKLTKPLRFANRLTARVLAVVRSKLGGPERQAAIASIRSKVTDSASMPATTPDFDADYYRKRYPDVAKSGIDPYKHYTLFGKAEGRSGLPAPLQLKHNGNARRLDRGYVLVVTHEATRTGAPVLAWNICNELRHQYNVVALLLGDGEILEYFESTADVMAGPYTPTERHTFAISPVIQELCERYRFEFAIVNSLVSRGVLQPLAEQFVPSIFLIHEFFNFFCSPDELVDAMAWANRTVFSASMVRDNAAIERTRPAANMSLVIPQGKSIIPAAQRHPLHNKKANALSVLIGKRKTKPFIVLGAGTVEYRKGVDLFVGTAAEIKRQDPDADVLFVWVGHRVEGHKDFAEFVVEHVKQTGLSGRFELLGPTPDLEDLYRLADICFISSRLDPLPNIAIDAMAAGLPVFCFENASGVAENLAIDALAELCIVPFLGIEEAARRILKLYRDPATYSQLSDRMKQIVSSRFDMGQYVGRLIALGRSLDETVKQEQRDIDALKRGADFVESFYLPPESARTRDEAILEYVKACQAGIFARKATPGFYPHVYAEQHDLTECQINPLVHFVQSGRPAGPWQESVIDVSKMQNIDVPRDLRVAVHLHVFYPDMLVDLIDRWASNDIRADFFVSVPSEQVAREVEARLSLYRGGKSVVRIVPNCGRDIGPLITEFADDLVPYDVIGHFHTKKSTHVVGSSLVRDWVEFLMQNLLGTKYRSARNILAEFAADPQLGLVFADDPNSIGWDKNLPYGEELAERMGIRELPTQFFSFPVGTMFWARPAALKPLFDLRINWDEYPDEPLPIDGSMLHAAERLLPTISRHAGFGIKVTYAPGVAR